MDGVSVAANIVGIATAGVAISIKLVTLATQISTASDRVSSIGNDISLTSGVLHQLGELMTQKSTGDGISIFSQGGLETTRTSAAVCHRIFREVEKKVGKASEQLRGCKRLDGGKVKLSKAEKAKWPFLQPSIDSLRADLREAKGTLMLMLQVTSLALSKRMADLNQSVSTSVIEQRDFMRAIVALEQQQRSARLVETSSDKHNAGLSNLQVPREASSVEPSTSGDDTATSLERAMSSTIPTRPKKQVRVARNTAMKIESPRQLSVSSTGSNIKTPEGMHFGGKPFLSLTAMPIPGLESYSSNDSTLWSDRSTDFQESTQAPMLYNARTIPEVVKTELQLFLLKPMVKDYFDKIELSWSLHNTKSQELAIREHIARNEKDGIPSVIDMLEGLHAHEQQVIDAELSRNYSAPEGSLLSLKRTKTDIRHRDIIMKDVPGLQFVVERQKVRSLSIKAQPNVDLSMGTFEPEGFRSLRARSPLSPSSRPSSGVSLKVPKIFQSLQSLPIDSRKGQPVTYGAHGEPHPPAFRGGKGPPPHDPTPDKHDTIRSGLESLKGFAPNKQGNIIGNEGVPVARLVQGDPKALVGKKLDREGNIKAESGQIVGLFELIPPNEREAKPEGPFAGLGSCVVVEHGLVEDEDGNTVATVVEGDARRLIGYAVDEDGDVIDKYGNVKGHAEPYEEPEGVVADLSSLEGKFIHRAGDVVDEYGTIFGHIIEGDPVELAGRKVDRNGLIWSDDMRVIGQADLLAGDESRISKATGKRSDVVHRTEDKERILQPDFADNSLGSMDMEHQQDLDLDLDIGNDEGSLFSREVTPSSKANVSRFSAYITQASRVNMSEHRTRASSPEESGRSMRKQPSRERVPAMVPLDFNVPDEKRKRDGTASYRFRQRRQEKEQAESEKTEEIAKLEQQVKEMEEERKLHRKDVELQVTAALMPRKRKADEEGATLATMEKKRRKIKPEDLMITECSDEDALVIDLLGKYTTLFE